MPNEVKLLPCELLVKQIAEQFCERYGELDFAPWESIVGSIAEAVEGSLSVKALEAGARAMRRRLCGLTFGEAVQLAEVAYPAIRAAMTRPTTVVTDEVVERVALIVGDKLGGHEGLGQVYRRNGDVRWKQSLEIARAALASMPTVVTGEQPLQERRAVTDFLRKEAGAARVAQDHAAVDHPDKLYRMGQKDGLMLAADAIERAHHLPAQPGDA